MSSTPHSRLSPASIKVNGWEKFLAGERVCKLFPFFTFLTVGVICTAIFGWKAASVGSDLFTFEKQSVRSSPIVQEYYAFGAARGSEQGCTSEHHQAEDICEEDQRCSWDGVECKEKALCPTPPPRPRENGLYFKVKSNMGDSEDNDQTTAWVGVIYEALNGNIFDDDILAQIDKFENKLLTTVNGAQFRNGTPSPWNKDWCRMAYPVGHGPTAPGKCAAPPSFINMFSMNAYGRASVAEQVKEGFSYAGPLSCMCSDADSLCSACTTEGGLKDFASWPTGVRNCMMGAMTAVVPNQTADKSTPSMCNQSPLSMGFDAIKVFLTDFCKSLPSCQWAPPGASPICTSTAFYHPTDGKGLVAGAEKEAVLSKICNEQDSGWWNMRRSRLPINFDCKVKRARYANTMFVAGGTGTSKEEGELFEEQYIQGPDGWYAKEQALEREIEDESGGKLRVMIFSAATLRTQYLDILYFDAALSMISLLLVWLYMWWTLESAFLASCAMFEIIYSLPVAACVWTVVLNKKIEFYQVLSIYMVLGIGADDCFILYDAWLQARFAGEEVMKTWKTRFAWAYRRSFFAMLVTTATTCASLVIGAFSPLPQVRDFSIFAGLVILVDWLFCITFFASALVVNERCFKSEKDPGECGGPGFACGGVRVFRKRFCKKEFPPADAPPRKRALERFCEGPLYNLLRRFRRAFIVFWVLAVIGMLTNAGLFLRTAEKRDPLGKNSLDAIRGTELSISEFSFLGTPTVSMAYGLDPDRPLESWGSETQGNKARFSAAAAAKVATQEGQRELLELCRAADHGDADHTRCGDRTCLILGRRRSGRCPADTPILRKTGIYIPEDILCLNGRYCFIEDFADYWAHYIAGAACLGHTNPANPAGCVLESGCQWDAVLKVCHPNATGDDYPGLPPSEFIDHLGSQEFLKYKQLKEAELQSHGRVNEVILSRKLTGAHLNHDQTALTFAWVSFNATYPKENSVREANEWHQRWHDFRVHYAEGIGGFETTKMYLFMVTQNKMVGAALSGIGLSLLVAFVVLAVATRNVRATALGLANIAAISAVFLGCMPILGWSLGENECIFLIVVVGLSVDYTVHLLHVYNHSSQPSREARCKDALAEMGISVTNSAITTLLAAVILFGCGFYFFFQFGAFVFLVIGFSIIMSIFFLMPLLMVCGPQGPCQLCVGEDANDVEDSSEDDEETGTSSD